ncbi:MAG: DNA gyrase inhibitor YacG [Xanthobacteraceae bacterium]
MCGKPSAQKYRPFCSKRCADVDLNRWFTGAYRVPVEETPEDADDRGRATEDE